MALRAGETALFCAVSNNVDWIKRAVAIGVDVSVIANDNADMHELRGVSVSVLRGSTSMLPARDASFDAAIAFHYLHEIDPFFHANVVSELGRVGKRCVIVEPAPPGDPLGRRIAGLYSRAKRELGEFENYHDIDYWRKLLTIVKSEVTYETFAFTRTPPRWAIRDTVAMIIATMAAEATPEQYLAELRALAKRPDAQLLPQARYVIVGAVAGARTSAGARTEFRERLPAELRPGAVFASPFAISALEEVAARAVAAKPKAPRLYSPAHTESEFPTVEAPPRRPGPPQPVAPASQIARNAFGLPADERTSARPAAVPTVKGDEASDAFGPAAGRTDPAEEFGWEWETPKGT
jgi:ubiquinone/menaquinone biosynthesis C-methylase UbiE